MPLGHHKEKYFSSPKANVVLNQFQTDLENLEREIIARNEQLDLPYDYMKPSNIEKCHYLSSTMPPPGKLQISSRTDISILNFMVS